MIVRPATARDYPAILEVVAAASQAEWSHLIHPAALHREITARQQNALVIAHRQVVGFARWAEELAPDGPTLEFEGWVLPLARRIGVGEALFVAAENAALQAGMNAIRTRNYATLPGFAELATARGFREERRFDQMWAAVPAAPQSERPLADGFRVETYADTWIQPLVEAENDAYAMHWGVVPGETTPDTVLRRIASVRAHPLGFDPGDFLLACKGGEVAAFVLAHPSPLDGPPGDGWIWHVGTRPAYRGLGLARALFDRALNRFIGRFERAGLHVDSQNGPAVALYRSLGFMTLRQRLHMVKPLPGAAPEPDLLVAEP